MGVAQGLSQGMIHGMVIDLKGYLWIGTKDGLNRYDGNHFHVLRHDAQDTNSIASNYIRCLHIDARGLIWAGTNADGLELYDPAQSRFIHFGTGHNPASPLKMQSVTRIFSDPSGRILVWDGSGNNCKVLVPVPDQKAINVNAWQVKSPEELYKFPADLPSIVIHHIVGFGQEGDLIISHKGNIYGLYHDRIKVYTSNDRNFRASTEVVQPYQPPIYFMDARHRLYSISKETRVLSIWDQSADAFRKLMQLPQDYPLLANRIFVDHLDRIWTNSSMMPLYRIDPKNGTCQLALTTRNHFAGMETNLFGIVAEDPQHNLWAGTSGYGVIKITSRNDKFTRKFGTSERTLIPRMVKNGFTYNLDEKLTYPRRIELEKRFEASGILSISSFVEDSLHQYWSVATVTNSQQHVLVRTNTEDLSSSQFPLDMCLRPAEEMSAAILIDRTGQKWMAGECENGEAHLLRIDPTGVQEVFHFPIEVIRNEHPFISDWYVDAQNNFWIGTKQGLFFFHPKTSQWKYFASNPTQTDALSHNYILSICPDPASPDTWLWIGTDGGGLNKMDIAKETFVNYSTKDGLPNNVIYAVQSDAHDNLWLSTNRGLCRFDPRTADTWAFTVEDGLPGNEFNRTEYAKDKDGRLYFAGVEGAVSFDPEVFYTSSPPSTIVINRLKLSNNEITYPGVYLTESGKEYQLAGPIENLQTLTFPYTERMITLGFSLLDFTNPEGNKYRYKLERFNTDWIDAGELNEAVFTNLNSGAYTFLVSGRNSNNVWSDPAKLQLIIQSPWWGTWWFRGFVIVLLAGGVYGFYRYRLKQAMKLQHLRNRIAADLHDEIGSTLSSISLAGTVIRHKLKSSHPEVDGLLHKINHNTQTMMEAMSDIVWAVNTKNDRFDQVLHRMRAFAVEILEPNDIMVHFDSSPNITHLLLDMQQRKNLYLIFKEVIHNAAKYAQCQNVWVTLTYKQGSLMMEVKDDGIGFEVQPVKETTMIDHDIALQKMGGNGIVNMYTRAEELKGKLELHSSAGQGTRVCLAFVV